MPNTLRSCIVAEEGYTEVERWRLLAWSIAWEGSIGLSRGKLVSNPELPWYTPRISLSNTDPNLMLKFCLLANCGNVLFFERLRQEHKNQFRWTLHGIKEAKLFLESILPYLPAKKKQAELVIEYCNIRLRNKRYGKRGLRGLHTREPREAEIWKELRYLNRKGKHE